MFKSIRWRFIIIFIVLVLAVMTISGVYIIQFTEQNSYDLVDKRLDALSKLILPDLEMRRNLVDEKDQVRAVINSVGVLGFREELYVVVNDTIVTASTDSVDKLASDVLSDTLILSALSGNINRKIETFSSSDTYITVMDKAYPIVSRYDDGVLGVLYLRYDLKDTNNTINRSRVIILQSVAIALLVTMLLGYLIANNVTRPINDLTQKAHAMARGDFSQRVDIKSDDEIGKLGEMFNLLNYRLMTSLNDISLEKSKLEAIFNNIDDGLIAITSDQSIIHINDKAVKLLAENDIAITDNYADIGQFLHDEMTFEAIKEKHPDWQGSETVMLFNGTYRVKFEPFNNEGMQRGGLIIVFQDITESHRLENMRREFVANVSHELKTPITSIKSYAETLLDGALEDKDIAREFLTVIDGETDRMSRLVKDLLTLSNFDSKRTRLEISERNYNDLIKAAAGKMQVHAEQKSQTLSVHLPPKRVIGSFDYHRLEQVVINLVSNAIKYTPEGGVVDVTLRQSKDKAVFSIADTGIGIAENDLPNLFERFYRVDKGRSRAQGGTGLGLAIVKEIVDLHGGDIDVISVLGKGTTITVRLPLGNAVQHEG